MQQALKEAIIDTDFINKITLATGIVDGRDLFIRTMIELNVKPVIHWKEMRMYSNY